MKSILMNFKDNVLSKSEMKSVKGGMKIMCGSDVYYGQGVTITSFGVCAGTSISYCEAQTADKDCYPGAVSVKSHGCYTVGNEA